MEVKLISWTKDPIGTVAKAASMCYASEPSRNVVRGCIKSGHTSILEMANYTFEIRGISRSCLMQLTRHRHASYAVESQRYVTYDDVDWVTTGLPLVLSPMIEQQADVSLEAYKDMVAMKHRAEDARAVLPNCMPTNLVMTMNLRAMMNFMHERLCSLAQTEIRMLATEMKKCVIACPDHTEEDADIIKSILVSKCQAREIPYCTERKWCGRAPNVEAVKKLIFDGHQLQNAVESFANGAALKELAEEAKNFSEKVSENS
ncbi:MAG: Thymidylate synthase ThyX [Bacteroidetes bacterium ADurb.Bin302]|nr:MAG: Thymidylate synthase ThyX [Bacteroidetes bacterium ADurb.Bin302]